MIDFVVALGLVAVLEGLLYAAAPAVMKKAIQQVLTLPDATVRIGGVAAMAIGVVLIWIARST